MHQVVADAESSRVDVLTRIQDFIGSRSCTDQARYAVKGLSCHVVHPLVLRRWGHSDGERSEDLPWVSVVVGADLGDEHSAPLSASISREETLFLTLAHLRFSVGVLCQIKRFFSSMVARWYSYCLRELWGTCMAGNLIKPQLGRTQAPTPIDPAQTIVPERADLAPSQLMWFDVSPGSGLLLPTVCLHY